MASTLDDLASSSWIVYIYSTPMEVPAAMQGTSGKNFRVTLRHIAQEHFHLELGFKPQTSDSLTHSLAH